MLVTGVTLVAIKGTIFVGTKTFLIAQLTMNTVIPFVEIKSGTSLYLS